PRHSNNAVRTLHASGLTLFFFSSRRRHTSFQGDWSSDVCSSDLGPCTRGCRSGSPEYRFRPVTGWSISSKKSRASSWGLCTTSRSEERRVGKGRGGSLAPIVPRITAARRPGEPVSHTVDVCCVSV